MSEILGFFDRILCFLLSWLFCFLGFLVFLIDAYVHVMQMVSYQAMNMSSATTQFAPTRAMAAMYEPFHQMSGWEETLRGDIIPAVSACVAPQATTGMDDKVKHDKLKDIRSALTKSLS